MSDSESGSTQRELAEEFFADVQNHVDGVDNRPTDPAEVSRTRIGLAQVQTLRAIYHELRHGHDQAAAESERMAAHTEALHQHADAMDKLRGALLEHAEAMSRFRNRDR